MPVPMPSVAMPALAEAAPGSSGGGGTIGLATGLRLPALNLLPCYAIMWTASEALVGSRACLLSNTTALSVREGGSIYFYWRCPARLPRLLLLPMPWCPALWSDLAWHVS